MSRIQIPLDVITSRLNIGDRFAGFRNTSLSSRFANMKPIGEFLDLKRFSKPANFAEVQSRVNYNLSTFSSNYAVVFVLLSIYALITNPLLLFDIILLAGGLWLLGRLNGQDLTIGTFKATSSQLYTGLLCTCGFLFLIASPFSTVLWLIGASGVVILGHAALLDKPIDEAFSGEAGRHAAPDDDSWNTSTRVVEELDSDDADLQNTRLAIRRSSKRYTSDDLRFTGIDMGSGRSRNKYAYQHSDDDNDLTESDSQATTDNETEDEARAEMENALVQSALARIRKARAKGKQDVKLNKGELAALERRRKRLQSEAEAAAKRKAADRKRRKEKEQRVAVPLSHLESALSNPRGSSTMLIQGQSSPPMGLFLPPSSSQARPRSSTSSSRRSSSQRHGSSSPFDYQYVSPGSNRRHVSDNARPSSSLKTLQHEDWPPQSQSSQSALDPFQYQTSGPPVPYSDMSLDGAPAAVGFVSGEIAPEDNGAGVVEYTDGGQVVGI
ncbi:hypothetical protein NUW58_g1077 [Xylaria curta]|uniref:Uncharacterized protein n=1 Tax=Xylaria curta TaxID=42375 RepID=A0ACC1PNV6_9PEZI|nr:hypothetical protein NUW58_g1077 [Xylaria curta]